MKTKTKILTLSAFTLLLFSCPSDDMEEECMKTIIVQYESTIYSQYGNIYIPEVTQEVPCDFPEPEDVKPLTQGDALENFSYEVIQWQFISDTGNNTSRLQFQIKLFNENDFDVKGNPILTIDSDNIQFSQNFTPEAINSCNEIAAESFCILSVDKEYPIDPNLGPPPTKFDLVSVKYILE